MYLAKGEEERNGGEYIRVWSIRKRGRESGLLMSLSVSPSINLICPLAIHMQCTKSDCRFPQKDGNDDGSNDFLLFCLLTDCEGVARGGLLAYRDAVAGHCSVRLGEKQK